MHDTVKTNVRPSHKGKSTSPFLAKVGTPRTGDDRLPGYYCEQQQMWMVDTEQGAQPIINDHILSQLQTKTRADEEEDDDSCLALELMTKTHQQIESDDDTRPNDFNSLLQLATKTDSIQEVDDSYSANQLLELTTKTEAQQEADDDSFHSLGFRY